MTEKMLAKENNLTININELTAEELEQLAAIYYRYNHMNECKEVNDRIAFIAY